MRGRADLRDDGRRGLQIAFYHRHPEKTIRMNPGIAQASDCKNAAVDGLTEAGTLLADRGYGINWLRKQLKDGGIEPCIQSRRSKQLPIPHGPEFRMRRQRIANGFTRQKDRHRVANHCNRCPKVCLPARKLPNFFKFRLFVPFPHQSVTRMQGLDY